MSPDDENYDFIETTVSVSANELYCEHMGEKHAFSAPISKQSRPCKEPDDEGNTVYEFYCAADLWAVYTIVSPERLTVAERDNALLTFKEEMQKYLNGLSESEITGGNIRTKLIEKGAEVANALSSENMQLSCEIALIEVSDAGQEAVQ